jgi:hypothetical protein
MMKSVISSMVSKLKVRIDTTEKALGDKLKLLDSDGDGQISFDEVKNVASTVMKKGHTSAEQLEQLFQVLDSNRDGKGKPADSHLCAALNLIFSLGIFASQCLWRNCCTTSTRRRRPERWSSWR